MELYDFKVRDNHGNEVSLKAYEGKVLLIVNTATKCGLTPQYKAMQELYDRYKDSGLEILDFPCNQFMHQAPGSDEEINEFCSLNYGTTFPRFAKIDVNGKQADPLYVWLKEQVPADKGDEETKAFEKKGEGVDPRQQKGRHKVEFRQIPGGPQRQCCGPLFTRMAAGKADTGRGGSAVVVLIRTGISKQQPIGRLEPGLSMGCSFDLRGLAYATGSWRD